MAPSGEAFAFGGSGGYVHLWCYSTHPTILPPYGPAPLPMAHPPLVRHGLVFMLLLQQQQQQQQQSTKSV
jgi:hypothetical protein